MATVEQVKSLSFEAGADLSADQHKFVVQDVVTGKVDVVGTAGTVQATGVLLNNPSAADQAATVAYSGVAKVIAAELLQPGDLVTSDDAGLAIICDTATHVILGVCQNDAAIGALAEVRLDNQGILA